ACGRTVAAPAPIGRVLDLPGSDRIEHHVSQYSEKAWPAFYDLCLVPSLQDMADAMMSPVEPAAIRAVDVVHQSREWMRRGPKQQVNVIWHEAVSKHFHAKTLCRSLEQPQIALVIDVIEEHFSFVVPTRHHVMQHSRGVQSQRTSHALRRATFGPGCGQ